MIVYTHSRQQCGYKSADKSASTCISLPPQPTPLSPAHHRLSYQIYQPLIAKARDLKTYELDTPSSLTPTRPYIVREYK